jgi:hypothetical protein
MRRMRLFTKIYKDTFANLIGVISDTKTPEEQQQHEGPLLPGTE